MHRVVAVVERFAFVVGEQTVAVAAGAKMFAVGRHWLVPIHRS